MVVFDLGERKHIYIEIVSEKQQNFEILEATFMLLKKADQEVEDQGICVIDGHTLDMIIQPQKSGVYTLKVEYHIADEVLIEHIDIQVNR